MWRGPPSLAQLPGRCRKTRPPRSPPPRARPGGGDSGRACAHGVPVCGGAGGVRVAERAWVTARACLSGRPDPSGLWLGRVRARASASLCAPGQVGSHAGWRGARTPFQGRSGGPRVDGRACVCAASLAPETFPERLMLGAQADLPGRQPAAWGAARRGRNWSGDLGVNLAEWGDVF